MPNRERYNTKARVSAPGSSRKKGKRKHPESSQSVTPEDSNVLLLIPKTRESKETEREERFRRELSAASKSKMSSKKKRRLEKYIDKKLNKEERIGIFEKLARSQASSTSNKLLPSSSLGSGLNFTHEERIARLEDKETRRVLDGLVSSNGGTRKRKRGFRFENNDTASEEEASPSDVDDAESLPRREVVAKLSPQVPPSPPAHWAPPLHTGPSLCAPTPSLCGNVSGDEDEWTGFSQKESGEEAGIHTEERVASEEADSWGSGIGFERQSPRRRTFGFKEWATKQLASAKGYEPSRAVTGQLDPVHLVSTASKPKSLKSRFESKGPLGELVSLPSTAFAGHVRAQHLTQCDSSEASNISGRNNVPIDRPEAIQAARLLLPIVAEEQPIMEAVTFNPVIVICGETGSGKTTQVPQFLYEAGFGAAAGENPGMIGVTQPRRVAAMSMASRVATELSLPSSRVSYQIRYDATVSPVTVIKFMTDGVLLRELSTDFLLTRYSVIIVDEAHERSMNTDILIGVLSRIVRLREEMWRQAKEGAKPLRLIIMSATLRVADFTSNTTLFRTPPPVINIPARQYPVTVHFNRRTVTDYVTEAVRKTVKIHSRLPPGGILVFLTGQNEIKSVCRKLEARFGPKAIRQKWLRQRYRENQISVETNDVVDALQEEHSRVPMQADFEAEDIDLGGFDEVEVDMDSEANSTADADALDSGPEASDQSLVIDTDDSNVQMHIVPLYSLLPSDQQMDVFRTPPLGARLVVVATNVAETSLTIPGIRYVVDCGRAKERKYDVRNGIQSFQVSWISKASAAQRAGRAGRTGPGHCYRLYSSALFEHHFDDFAQPEILRLPIEGIVLQMKSMNIDTVFNFPFPTPPDRINLRRAETALFHLGSLEGTLEKSRVTDLGRMMALFPLSPRYSKMLVAGRQHGCLRFVISIVSALSVGDPFLHEDALAGDSEDLMGEETQGEQACSFSYIRNSEFKEAAKTRRRAFFLSLQTHGSLGGQSSDVFRMLSVVGAYEYAGGLEFCVEHFVRPKAMEEIRKLRYQITQIVQANFPDVAEGFVPKMRPPNDTQLKILRQLLTASFVDQVAVRRDIIDKSTTSGHKYASSCDVPYKALGVPEDVFIHPSSVLYHVTPPEYVVFHEIVRTSRPWIKVLTIINPAWLPKLGPTLCTFSKPLKSSGGEAVVIPKYGPDLWELPPMTQHT